MIELLTVTTLAAALGFGAAVYQRKVAKDAEAVMWDAVEFAERTQKRLQKLEARVDLSDKVRVFMNAADQPADDFETALVYQPITAEEVRERLDAFELLKQDPNRNSYRVEHLDGICDEIWCLYAEANAIGYDIDGAMAEVARSNLSKVSNGKIKKTPSGKVIKPETYSPPDLKPFIWRDKK